MKVDVGMSRHEQGEQGEQEDAYTKTEEIHSQPHPYIFAMLKKSCFVCYEEKSTNASQLPKKGLERCRDGIVNDFLSWCS